jgi:hypothetical protein
MQMFGTYALAFNGNLTGNNHPTDPKSLLLPYPGSKSGYITIPYGRFEPFASWIALNADIANAVRDGMLRGTGWSKALQDVGKAFMAASIDKSFLEGNQTMSDFFDLTNWTVRTKGGPALELVFGPYMGAPGAIVRAFSAEMQPYKTINNDETSPWSSLVYSFRQRIFGGAGNPYDYDIYTGRLVPKSFDPNFGQQKGGKPIKHFDAVAASFMDEAVYPGESRIRQFKTEVSDVMDFWGYKKSKNKYTKTAEKVVLTPPEVSALRYDIFHVGRLAGKLEDYIDGPVYKAHMKVAELAKKAGDDEQLKVIRERVHMDLDSFHDMAKEQAIEMGQLSDPMSDFQRRVRDRRELESTPMSSLPQINSQAGLLAAWGQGQATIDQTNNA